MAMVWAASQDRKLPRAGRLVAKRRTIYLLRYVTAFCPFHQHKACHGFRRNISLSRRMRRLVGVKICLSSVFWQAFLGSCGILFWACGHAAPCFYADNCLRIHQPLLSKLISSRQWLGMSQRWNRQFHYTRWASTLGAQVYPSALPTFNKLVPVGHWIHIQRMGSRPMDLQLNGYQANICASYLRRIWPNLLHLRLGSCSPLAPTRSYLSLTMTLDFTPDQTHRLAFGFA